MVSRVAASAVWVSVVAGPGALRVEVVDSLPDGLVFLWSWVQLLMNDLHYLPLGK